MKFDITSSRYSQSIINQIMTDIKESKVSSKTSLEKHIKSAKPLTVIQLKTKDGTVKCHAEVLNTFNPDWKKVDLTTFASEDVQRVVRFIYCYVKSSRLVGTFSSPSDETFLRVYSLLRVPVILECVCEDTFPSCKNTVKPIFKLMEFVTEDNYRVCLDNFRSYIHDYMNPLAPDELAALNRISRVEARNDLLSTLNDGKRDTNFGMKEMPVPLICRAFYDPQSGIADEYTVLDLILRTHTTSIYECVLKYGCKPGEALRLNKDGKTVVDFLTCDPVVEHCLYLNVCHTDFDSLTVNNLITMMYICNSLEIETDCLLFHMAISKIKTLSDAVNYIDLVEGIPDIRDHCINLFVDSASKKENAAILSKLARWVLKRIFIELARREVLI